MQTLNDIKHVYFLGIGGIGMSALARYFLHSGIEVAGYDRTATPLTAQLEQEGIAIHYTDEPDLLPKWLDQSGTLVIYTPAIPSDNEELKTLIRNGFNLRKRAEVLGLICQAHHTIAVAGTHGKTSVSTMTAHILKQSAIDCTAFLGGISKNYQTNLLLAASGSNWAVVEADEFDRSFLHLHPQLAVITSMDADHLDIYGSHDMVIESFNHFAEQIEPGGTLVIKKDIESKISDELSINTFTYSLEEKADFYCKNLILQNGYYQFDLVTPLGDFGNLRLRYPGLMNVENAIAASAMALLAGVEHGELQRALDSYSGVKRRFDIHLNTERFVLIDDYAHHPEELRATINSVKELYKGRKVTGIFQPHLYSRTRDFAEEFAENLDLLDEVILLEIYPARELPIPGISAKIIFDQIKNKNKIHCKKEELTALAEKLDTGVILMMGAGDIDTMVEPIKKKLMERQYV